MIIKVYLHLQNKPERMTLEVDPNCSWLKSVALIKIKIQCDVVLTFSTKQDSKERRLISTSAWEAFSGKNIHGNKFICKLILIFKYQILLY